MRENYFLIQILLARGKYDQKSAEEETGNTTRGKDMLSAFHGGRKLQRKEILKKFLVEIQSYRTTTRGKRTVSSSGVWCVQRTPYNTDWTHPLILGLTPPCRHSEAKYPLCHRPTVPPLFWRSKGWILTLLIPNKVQVKQDSRTRPLPRCQAGFWLPNVVLVCITGPSSTSEATDSRAHVELIQLNREHFFSSGAKLAKQLRERKIGNRKTTS